MLTRLLEKYFTPTRAKQIKHVTIAIGSNTAFACCLRITADGLQQSMEKKKMIKYSELNTSRSMSVGMIGVVIGPPMYFWYTYLDKILPGKTFGVIAKKIVLDQMVGGTFFIFVYIVGICLIEGQTFRQSIKEFLQKFPFVYMMDWLVWPPTQYLNFYLVPAQFRVLFVNLILFLWNVFLSYIKYNEINFKSFDFLD